MGAGGSASPAQGFFKSKNMLRFFCFHPSNKDVQSALNDNFSDDRTNLFDDQSQAVQD